VGGDASSAARRQPPDVPSTGALLRCEVIRGAGQRTCRRQLEAPATTPVLDWLRRRITV
jgi:hypothetical protein